MIADVDLLDGWINSHVELFPRTIHLCFSTENDVWAQYDAIAEDLPRRRRAASHLAPCGPAMLPTSHSAAPRAGEPPPPTSGPAPARTRPRRCRAAGAARDLPWKRAAGWERTISGYSAGRRV